MSAGGSDNCNRRGKKKKKKVQPAEQVGLSQVSALQAEHADPQLRLQRPRNKTAQTAASDVSGRRECVCQSARGDGVKPKALAPGLHNAGMTGGLGQGISEVGVGIPSIRPSLPQRNLVCNGRKELTDVCGFAAFRSCFCGGTKYQV